MFGLIIALHIISCIFLIFVILIQPGKGYGLSETFGGQTQSIFGTRAATFMTRITALSAAIFLLTSLTLAVISGKRSRSIMERVKTEEVRKEAAPKLQEAVPPATENIPATEPASLPQPAQQNQ